MAKKDKMGAMPACDEDWKVDDAVSTLMRAEEIKADSTLMAKVQKKIEKKKRAISSIADLKAARDEAYKEEDQDEEAD